MTLPKGFVIDDDATTPSGELPEGFVIDEAKPQQQSWDDWFGGVARAAAQGATFNFGDEIEAFVRARVGSGDYEAEVAKIRDEIDQFRESNPWASGVTEFAAGMLLPGGVAIQGARKAATLASAARAGAAAGAGFGAVSGFGAGEDVDSRVTGAGVGAVAGGALGAGLPYASRVVGEIGEMANAGLVRAGIKSADAAADKTILKGVQADAKAAGTDATQEIDRLLSGDAPIYSAGQNVRRLADDAARFGDEAGEQARKFVDAASLRRTDAEDLLGIDDLAGGRPYAAPDAPDPASGGGNNFGIDDIAGGRDYQSVMQEVMDRRRDGMNRAYEGIYAQPPRSIPALDRMVQRDPNIRRAFTRAARKSASYAEREGPPVRYVDILDDTGRLVGQRTQYTPRMLDNLSRELTDSRGAASRAGRGQEAIFFGDLKDKLQPLLDDALPDLGALQRRYASESALVRAGEHGRNFRPEATGRQRDEWFAALDNMGSEERAVALAGIRESIRDTARRLGDDKVVRRLAQSGDFERNILDALGNEGRGILTAIRGEQDRLAAAAQDADVVNFGRSFRPDRGDRTAKDWMERFRQMSATERERLLPGAREAIRDAVDRHGDLEKAITSLSKNERFRERIEEVFGEGGSAVAERVDDEARKISTETNLLKAANKGPAGRALIEEKDAGKLTADVAVASAMGLHVPVYLAYNLLRKATAMDQRTAKAVIDRLTAMRDAGIDVEELAKRLSKLDAKTRAREMTRLRLSSVGGAATGMGAGEMAAEGRAAYNREDY